MDQDRISDSRKRTKYWIYAAISIYAVSFVLMAAFGIYAIIQGQRVNKALCQVSNDNRTTLVNILESSKQQALERSISTDERNLIRISYDRLIALVPPVKCGTGGPRELEP